MRIKFVNTLIQEAKKNKNIILLTGDLGYSVFEEFIKQFPDQYINAGVAEQNMTGVAAGLAMEGRIPIIYSIVPFVTMRNFEQIRNDICYQNLNVKIVGVGAGFSYGPYGHTHHGLEDIGILRTLANMTILGPGDPVETEACTELMIKHIGPVYLRLGKKGEPNIHQKNVRLKVGSLIPVRKGKKLVIIGTSTMLETAVKTANLLLNKGVHAAVYSCPIIKPFPVEDINKFSLEYDTIVSIEEHSLIGGLGTAIAETIADHNLNCKLKRFGVPDRFTKVIGNQEFMRKANGLLPEQIAKNITKFNFNL